MEKAPIITQILDAVRAEVAEASRARPEAELRRMVADAPPPRPLAPALAAGFGLIAEIKTRSPSMGAMRPANVAHAPAAYQASPAVHAISVLTNRSHFDMSVQRIAEIRKQVSKPLLRKDFILGAYQVLEARAFGADAILLMSQVLPPDHIAVLQGLAHELGMDALVECHTRKQIEQAPPGTTIFGINSRSFHLPDQDYARSRTTARADLTVDLDRFRLVQYVPPAAIKVAESGIGPDSLPAVRQAGFHAALVGTRLLLDPDGVAAALARFENALA